MSDEAKSKQAAEDENTKGAVVSVPSLKQEDDDDNNYNSNNNDDSSADHTEEDDGSHSKDDGDTKEDTSTEKESVKKEEAPVKKKVPHWPTRDIKETHENDVLYGRGGGTNHHPGNKRFRKMVEDRKLDYVNSKRLDKPLVALEIIQHWRSQDPPGRFLKLDEKTGLWHDVGDKKAREKTSQALREKAPLLRKQQEEDLGKSADDEDLEESPVAVSKNTRFAEGTHKEKDETIQKAVLARDHSLGREYLGADEVVTVDGFSWQEPLVDGFPYSEGERTASDERLPSHGSLNTSTSHFTSGHLQSHGSTGVPGPSYHNSRTGSQASSSTGGYAPDYRVTSEDRQSRYLSSGRSEGWHMGSSAGTASSMPPPMPGYGAYPHHTRSGSWSATPSGREHSLSYNPLRDASITQPAVSNAFDAGYWPEFPPLPPGGQSYSRDNSQSRFHNSDPSFGRREYSASNHANNMHYSSPPRSAGPPQYSVDATIAQTWSSNSDERERTYHMPNQDLHRSWSGEDYGRKQSYRSGDTYAHDYDTVSALRRQPPGVQYDDDTDSDLPRPQPVKRMTSNQNESVETKKDLRGPSVKRAALNRDNSLASNRLKQAYLTDSMNKAQIFDSDKEVKSLSGNLEQTTLNGFRPKPKPLTSAERTSTLDQIAMELMSKPDSLSSSKRSSTMDMLAIDLDNDPIFDIGERSNTEDALIDPEVLTRPVPLSMNGRLSTMDYLDLVNSPLEEDEEQDTPLGRATSVGEWLTEV